MKTAGEHRIARKGDGVHDERHGAFGIADAGYLNGNGLWKLRRCEQRARAAHIAQRNVTHRKPQRAFFLRGFKSQHCVDERTVHIGAGRVEEDLD